MNDVELEIARQVFELSARVSKLERHAFCETCRGQARLPDAEDGSPRFCPHCADGGWEKMMHEGGGNREA